MKRPRRPQKMESSALLALIRGAEREGLYTFVDHAEQRLLQREVTVGEVQQVLRDGWRAPKHDKYREDFRAWNYALRGKTVDGRNLRLAVAVEGNGLLVITVIDLDRKDQN